MTGNNYLFDTSIIIELFLGNTDITKSVKHIKSINISATVLGELFVGINRVTNKQKHLKKLKDFLEICNTIQITNETAEQYGAITAQLYKLGKPLPSNDIWIAATALQHDLTLITKDNHFKFIKNLKLKSL